MSRITDEERKRFHKIIDDSIDKLNNDKNINKEHWSKMSIPRIQKHINVENAELDCAMLGFPYYQEHIQDEGFDIINYTLFLIDNIRSNR